MLVKAKWNVKDSAGWHSAGDVFNTDEDLGDAVEALETAQQPVPAEPDTPVQESAQEPEKEPEKPRTRRKSAR